MRNVWGTEVRLGDGEEESQGGEEGDDMCVCMYVCVYVFLLFLLFLPKDVLFSSLFTRFVCYLPSLPPTLLSSLPSSLVTLPSHTVTYTHRDAQHHYYYIQTHATLSPTKEKVDI